MMIVDGEAMFQNIKNKAFYSYQFSEDGKELDNKGYAENYSLSLDYDKVTLYNIKKYSACRPFERGVIYLKIGNDLYFAVKYNGFLCLFGTDDMHGGDGMPKYRYKMTYKNPYE